MKEKIKELLQKYNIEITSTPTGKSKTVKEKIIEVPNNMNSYSFGGTPTVKEVTNTYNINTINVYSNGELILSADNKIDCDTIKDDTPLLNELKSLLRYYNISIYGYPKSIEFNKGYSVILNKKTKDGGITWNDFNN